MRAMRRIESSLGLLARLGAQHVLDAEAAEFGRLDHRQQHHRAAGALDAIGGKGQRPVAFGASRR